MSNIFKVSNKDTRTISVVSIVKDYLRHKTISSQNVSSESLIKNFVISLKY